MDDMNFGQDGERSAMRPVPPHVASQMRARHAFEAAQARWEASARGVPVTRDDVGEELASKAGENRARVAFLSTKGATMKGWLDHCRTDTARRPVSQDGEQEQPVTAAGLRRDDDSGISV